MRSRSPARSARREQAAQRLVGEPVLRVVDEQAGRLGRVSRSPRPGSAAKSSRRCVSRSVGGVPFEGRPLGRLVDPVHRRLGPSLRAPSHAVGRAEPAVDGAPGQRPARQSRRTRDPRFGRRKASRRRLIRSLRWAIRRIDRRSGIERLAAVGHLDLGRGDDLQVGPGDRAGCRRAPRRTRTGSGWAAAPSRTARPAGRAPSRRSRAASDRAARADRRRRRAARPRRGARPRRR